jgi:sulfatase modifying factor 1
MLRSFRLLALFVCISAACDGNVILDSGDGDDGPADDDDARPDAPDEASDAEGTDAEDVQPDTELDAEAEADACALACVGRECGDDGCGGTCGPGCGAAETCTAEGFCQPTGETWVRVPAGTFIMGSPPSEAGREAFETQHPVTLTRAFLLEATEVTQAQFAARMGYNPSSHADCPDCPVEQVRWHEAAAYCNALSATSGRPSCYTCRGTGLAVECFLAGSYAAPYPCPGYRLPTEAEWEYAARAGDERATYNGNLDAAHLTCESPNPVLDPIAWFCGNRADETQPTGLLRPNAWALFDMLGGVFEWCADQSDHTDYEPGPAVDPYAILGGYRVSRGGCRFSDASVTRAAQRGGGDPAVAYIDYGFRPARTVAP